MLSARRESKYYSWLFIDFIVFNKCICPMIEFHILQITFGILYSFSFAKIQSPFPINYRSDDAVYHLVKVWLAQKTIPTIQNIITIELVDNVCHEIGLL